MFSHIGVANHDVNNVEMEYSRSFTLPSKWKSDGVRVLLHFDAVDHAATVSVNGHKVGSHAGGSVVTSCQINTAALEAIKDSA